MDPFFVELEKRRQQNIQTSPENEAERIVTEIKDRIGDRERGTVSVRNSNMDPAVQVLVQTKVGAVQIKETKSTDGKPEITYRVTW